jgi:peptidoglycan/xylan/chitin deacetylase (PgdA/CDA1 family)
VFCAAHVAPMRYPRLNADRAEAQLHSSLKRRVERMVSTPAVGWITRRRVRAKRLILAYHGIVPDGEPPAGERALFIRQSDFAAQLDTLRVVTDVAALDRIDEPGDGRPRVAITIDDAYRGAVDVGVRELAARSIPATIFVAPGRLNNHVFWWDALAHKTGMLDSELRNHALQHLGGVDERIRTWATKSAIPSCDELPAYARTASREELAAALKFPGITLGSHTWTHPNLASLGIADIVPEVRRSREWLQAEFGNRAIDWLAYPYGLESLSAQIAVGEATYTGALRITGGWYQVSRVSRFLRPRLNVGAGLSVAGFRARLQGAVLS